MTVGELRKLLEKADSSATIVAVYAQDKGGKTKRWMATETWICSALGVGGHYEPMSLAFAIRGADGIDEEIT